MVCLLVGEGDFSFALALAAQRGAANLVASCLLHGSLDVGARANVDRLSAMGVRVLTDVDARCLHEHPWVSHCCTELSEIVFNFPHVGGKMRIGDNRKLLRDFFLSAGRVLRPGLLVRVTLCRGQGGTPADSKVRRCPSDTWQVVEMAAPGGFILHRVVPFRAPAGYTPRGYRSMMATDKTPLGRTVHRLASALELDLDNLVASWAAKDGVDDAAVGETAWRCYLERSHACSPVHPPFGHILDIDVRDRSGMKDVLLALQDICGDTLMFSFPAVFPDSVKKRMEPAAEDDCHAYCDGLHVATFRTPVKSPRSPMSAGSVPKNFISSLNLTSSNCSYEENSCSLQPNGHNLLSSLNLDNYNIIDLILPCEVSIHVELLSLASSGLGDWRLLLPRSAPDPGPLYPTASFTHDISFWLGEGFNEENLLVLIYDTAGDLLRSMELVDDYVDAKTGRRSRCYRLCYQSLWKALSQEAARDFHLALGVAVSQVLPVEVR
ncbi:ferredoxin-fold anticodon-binding domain-containing protein 1 homolog isoform X3 [Dermacentor andersoni]|uniref:ferredoxin-fold anticodon-binding domain-containing protein 1 homolog isoform X3 n=1 Tax=Dermacentor andersoni TaxID=34620 RepID=UPI002416869F|nr:ferredoxin-fold anticodon-binding domain-containing protein 1-like isoform X3 [Dermacentor andersoni]